MIGIHFELPFEVPFILSDRRVDPYHWMRKNRADFFSFTEKTTATTHSYLSPLRPLTDKLISEMEAKVDLEFPTSSKKVGSYLYYTKYEEKSDYPTFFRKKIGAQTEERLCKWGSKVVLEYTPSPDGRYIAFTVDDKGTQFGNIHIFDTKVNTLLNDDTILNSNGNLVWNLKSDGFWYVKANDLKRSDSILFHQVLQSPTFDTIYYFERDIQYEIDIKSDDESLYVTSSSIKNSEIRIGKLDQSTKAIDLIIPRTTDLMVNVIPSKNGTFLLIHQDDDNGTFYQLQKNRSFIPIFIATDFIVNVIPLRDFFIIEKRKDGLPSIEVFNRSDKSSHEIPFPLGQIQIASSDYEKGSFSIVHSSPIKPPSLMTYQCSTKSFEKNWEKNTGDYVLERVFAQSDGINIPITLAYRKGIKKNGQNPLLIYAYGAYGSTIDPPFSKPYASLLERGVIIAYAHVRGGGEYGNRWHNSAKGKRKINTFKDLICCTNYLIQEGFTNPQKLGLQGGSAGGTLAAGIINMRPDLFRVVILEMPFVDAITDLSDINVPYTPQEWEEWGNPTNSEDLRAIKEWSPLDHIRPSLQPAAYITAGEYDVQVLNDEPYKLWAKLVQNQQGSNPILFEMLKGGHKGDLGRYSSIRQVAPMYAFLLDQLGIQR